MARYFHLQIYKASFDFLLYYATVLHHFNREYKYTLGEKMLYLGVDFIILIYKTNSAKEYTQKVDYLNQMDDIAQFLNVTLRLCSELGAISRERYMRCCDMIAGIEKQLFGWKAYIEKKIEEGKPIEEDVENSPNKEANEGLDKWADRWAKKCAPDEKNEEKIEKIEKRGEKIEVMTKAAAHKSNDTISIPNSSSRSGGSKTDSAIVSNSEENKDGTAEQKKLDLNNLSS